MAAVIVGRSAMCTLARVKVSRAAHIPSMRTARDVPYGRRDAERGSAIGTAEDLAPKRPCCSGGKQPGRNSAQQW